MAVERRHWPAPGRVAMATIALAVALAACTGSGTVPASPSGAVVTPGPTPGGPATAAPTIAATASPAASMPGPTAPLPTSGTWARVSIDGAAPAAREDHTWTVDGDGAIAWLFGGRDGGAVFDDLWAFDLRAGTWRKVAVTGDAPAARFGHEAAWVPGRGLILFGGQRGATFFDDLWLFEPRTGTWRLLPPGSGAPVARYGSCSGMGPDGRFWISHGFTEDGIRFADTLAYDLGAEGWSDEAPPTSRPVERCLHACWWTADGRFALYGGQTTGVPALGDLWFFAPGTGGASTNEWSEAAAQAPAARQLAAIARRGGATFLFGGRGTDRAALAETWLIADGATGFARFATSGDEPAARSGAALIDDADGARLLLFGGVGADVFDDLWSLSFP